MFFGECPGAFGGVRGSAQEVRGCLGECLAVSWGVQGSIGERLGMSGESYGTVLETAKTSPKYHWIFACVLDPKLHPNASQNATEMNIKNMIVFELLSIAGFLYLVIVF